MKKSSVAACVLALAAVAHADQSVVKGELTFDSAGVGQITECGTHRIIELGVMASTPYFYFVKRYEEVSVDGRDRVLIEVEGRLTSSSTGKLVLGTPRVVGLKSGVCANG
jgi:hypothetical protein